MTIKSQQEYSIPGETVWLGIPFKLFLNKRESDLITKSTKGIGRSIAVLTLEECLRLKPVIINIKDNADLISFNNTFSHYLLYK